MAGTGGDRRPGLSGFTKRNAAAPAGFFRVEATGLAWLAVPGGVPVVTVLDVDDTSITLERVAEGRPTAQAAFTFGSQLARTHDAGASAFGIGPNGWQGDGFIGNAPLSLRPHPHWGEFYAAERVMPYARAAVDQGSLDAGGLAPIEALAHRLAAGEFDDDAAPARIHGDLWAGNVLFTDTAAVLIDPAAHGGHRITDLAMLELFGLPYLDQVFAGYAAASSDLPHDWRDLIALHQLHPLLVHAVLFGGSYAPRAAALARRY
ncbi:MAG TPA: fructosamine kinase family protein [Propionicimonas sp.]|nr:fructosamine kinase family protein [Propionicimonas sp.]